VSCIRSPIAQFLKHRRHAPAKAKDKAGKTAFDYAKSNYGLRARGNDVLKQLEEASK